MWKYAKDRGYSQVELVLVHCHVARTVKLQPQQAHTSSKRDIALFGLVTLLVERDKTLADALM